MFDIFLSFNFKKSIELAINIGSETSFTFILSMISLIFLVRPLILTQPKSPLSTAEVDSLNFKAVSSNPNLAICSFNFIYYIYLFIFCIKTY